jgi:hypothetical protein
VALAAELATLENNPGRGKKGRLVCGAAAGFSGSQIREERIIIFSVVFNIGFASVFRTVFVSLVTRFWQEEG